MIRKAEAKPHDEELEAVSYARPAIDTNFFIQMLVGILGMALVALAVYPLRTYGGVGLYIFEVINKRGPIQYFELFMAFMVIAHIIMKRRLVRLQYTALADSPIGEDLDLHDDTQIQDLRREVTNKIEYTWSLLLHRIDRTCAVWLGSKDAGRVADWGAAESERELSSSASSYGLATITNATIPILGFIGTVLGLGKAVSGFSSFLGGDVEMSQIKVALAEVTGGLSTAFDTTLLALVLNMMLSFPLNSVQRKEETFLLEMDIYVDDNLSSRFPPPEEKPIVLENLEDAIEAAFRRYIPDPDRYDEVFTRAIERAGKSVEERFSNLAQEYEASLRDLTGRIQNGITTAGGALEDSMRKVASDINDQEKTLIDSRKQIAEDETVRMQGLLKELQDSAADVSRKYAESASQLENSTRDTMEKSMSASNTLAERMESIQQMASAIEGLLHVEEAVQKGLEGIAASDDFKTTLSNIREHLNATDAFVEKLSRPRVITLEEEIKR